MHLYDVPIVIILAGLALYTILGGADFGAGIWQLLSVLGPGRGARSDAGTDAGADATAIREHAHHAIGPVWEANHVWLIFVLTVTWTAYPTAFGAIASTLFLPLLLAGVGIIFRGATYALRSATVAPREIGVIDTGFSLASFLTPFALGTMIGALVTGRVPPGNAAGPLFASWLNPVSLLTGVLFVVISAYMAAVYLAADAARHHEADLADAFRSRALASAAVAGALAVVGLVLLHADAHRVFERLVAGPGLIGAVLSILGGVGTFGFVARRAFSTARVSAAVAVVGLIVGWALAQAPRLLPGLTLGGAAAPTATLIALLVAVAMGVLVLFPALGWLFRLVLSGTFDTASGPDSAAGTTRPVTPSALAERISAGLAARAAVAGLVGGIGLLNLADPGWCHILGVLCLVGCAAFAWLAIDPAGLADAEA